VANKIAEIRNGELVAYQGNYHYYLEKIAEEKEKARQERIAAEKRAKEREKQKAKKAAGKT
jgi:ATPase components of ABC transporters with duplicated ATPase domains